MRVLFDQGTPVPLRDFLNSHTITTVYEKGWSSIPNGDLLRLADQEMFEVFSHHRSALEIPAKSHKPPDRDCGIADDKLAGDPKTHSQDRSCTRLHSAGRFYRNRFLTIDTANETIPQRWSHFRIFGSVSIFSRLALRSRLTKPSSNLQIARQ